MPINVARLEGRASCSTSLHPALALTWLYFLQPYNIRTDDREKFVQEIIVHMRTDHVFRTWTVSIFLRFCNYNTVVKRSNNRVLQPALMRSEVLRDQGRSSKEATIDLAAPPKK